MMCDLVAGGLFEAETSGGVTDGEGNQSFDKGLRYMSYVQYTGFLFQMPNFLYP